jgi:outer membrane protein
MNKTSTILIVIAFVLIGLLFYLHITHVEELKKVGAVAEKNAHMSFKVAYFDPDSLQIHYDYCRETFDKIKADEKNMNIQLGEMMNKNQQRIREWQEKGTNMSQKEGEQAKVEYNNMQDEFEKTKKSLEQNLQRQQMDLMTNVRNKIEIFLKDYGKEHGYSYIFSYEPAFMYYKDSVYDITSDIVNALNAAYKKEGKQ